MEKAHNKNTCPFIMRVCTLVPMRCKKKCILKCISKNVNEYSLRQLHSPLLANLGWSLKGALSLLDFSCLLFVRKGGTEAQTLTCLQTVKSCGVLLE